MELKKPDTMLNFQVMAWNGKRYQAIAGIDNAAGHAPKPVFVGNRIHGIVLWGYSTREMDTKQAEMQAKYPGIQFKLEVC